MRVDGRAPDWDAPGRPPGSDDVVVEPLPHAQPERLAWRDLGQIAMVRGAHDFYGGSGSAWELLPSQDSPGLWPVEQLRILRTYHRRQSVGERFGHGLPLRADWFSAVLRIGRGLSAEVGSRDFVWPEERLVEVRSGRVWRIRRH